MKNVMLLASALDTGGAERVIAHLARRLDRSRFRVTVCHLMNRGTIGNELASDGYDVVGVARDGRRIRRYFSFVALRREIRGRRIDLIHSHTHYALADGALCTIGSRRAVKLVHTFHHGNYPHIPRRYRLLEACASRRADRLVAVGIEQEKSIRSTLGLSTRRMDVVLNGAELASASVDEDWQVRLRGGNAVVIGTICTFIEQKGLPDLLRVAAEFKRTGVDALFVVVGDGVLRASIEEECRRLGLSDRVLFTGMKHAASSTMLPLFDIFFQPSLWEAMSMVVIEAMAAGVPVVATDVGDNRHVVVDGATGYIVPKGDVPAMVRALERLVASPDLRRSLGDAGRQRYQERYTVALMTAAYERLYTEVLTG